MLLRLEGLVAKKHQDTTISLQPLSFEEAIAALANSPRQTDSQSEESDSTKEVDLGSETSKKQTVQRQKPSSG